MSAFTVALRRAMTERGMSVRELSEAAGISTTLIKEYRSGATVPGLASAAALADALMSPAISAAVIALRTGTCASPGCGATFVSSGNGGRPRTHCSTRCYHRDNQAARRRAKRTYTVLDRDVLADFRRTLLTWCMDCTGGEGICRDGGCTWRDLSPLPLARQAGRAA